MWVVFFHFLFFRVFQRKIHGPRAPPPTLPNLDVLAWRDAYSFLRMTAVTTTEEKNASSSKQAQGGRKDTHILHRHNHTTNPPTCPPDIFFFVSVGGQRLFEPHPSTRAYSRVPTTTSSKQRSCWIDLLCTDIYDTISS